MPDVAVTIEERTAADWVKRGAAWLEDSAPAAAMACFRNCLALEPAHVDGLWQSARLEATLERRIAATALLERLIAVAPDFQEAFVVLAQMDAGLGWLDRANARFATLGRELTGWWEATRVERLAAVRQARDSLAGLGAIETIENPVELARVARGRLSLGHLPACAAALRRLESLRPGSGAAAAIRVQLVLRERGLPAALAYLRALPEPVQEGLQLAHARLLYESGDFAGVAVLLGANTEESGALHLLTLSSFASGAREAFFDASKRLMGAGAGETRAGMFAIAAARQQGVAVRFDDAPVMEQAARTPLLHYWHSRDIPPDVAACLASWRDRNPSLEQRVLCRDEARAVIAARESRELLRCFDEARHPAMQSDIIRLVILAHEGGLYVDADERCMAPLTPLLQRLGGVEFAGWLSPDTPPYLYNGFLAVRRGSRLVRSALEELVLLRRDHRARGIRSDVWQVSGPGLITRAVARALSEAGSAGTIMLMIDREWRRFAHTDETLAYKQTSAGNWRLG